jgi:GT2 family glycosyltransferase
MTEDDLIRRLRRLKLRLRTGGVLEHVFVPLVEVLEFSLSHGLREVAFRTRIRLRTQFSIGREREHEVPASYQPALLDLKIPPPRDREFTSIVIPVLNHPKLTRACLASVIERTPAGTYEIIVVDNASDDETRRLLAEVDSLRVIRNDVNAGFVEACNQGAGAAQGEFILFLNNDTIVLPGWLDALRSTFDTHESVGAVGPMLLYPDGRLQEAGVIIWRDGTASHYGRFDGADAPEFGYVREVDYCSGACLLIPKSVFERLGGFDSRYAPAYYEDVDLAFRLRELGSRVLYQPAARVVHVEGATAGTTVSHGMKSYQAVNRGKFVARHERALATQHSFDPESLREACDRRSGRRILVMDERVPHHDEDAGSVRLRALLEILSSLNCRVTFVPNDRQATEPYTSQLQQLGIEVRYGAMSGLAFAKKFRAAFDVAILCRARTAAGYIAALSGSVKRPFIILDTVDLNFLREQRFAELEDDPGLARSAERSRDEELSAIRSSDMVWVTSTHEAELLSQHDAVPAIATVPMIHSVRQDVPGFGARRDVLFVGGFRHAPNEDAVLYFVEEIWPIVQSALPGVRFLIAGSYMPPRIERLASTDIEILGHVPDVKDVLDRCRVSVAPLRYGAGVKGKVTESLASGVPVVATPVAAEGIGLTDGAHLLIGADSREFASRLIRVYTDEGLWDRLSHGGRHAMNRCSEATVRELIRTTLERTRV